MPGRWYYGWSIVGVMLVALMIGTGLTFWSFTVYIPPLEAEFGWSRAQVSTAFSVTVLVSGLMAPFAGRMIDRVGARTSIGLGSVGLAATFFLFPFVTSLWQFVAVYALQALIMPWMMGLPFQWLLTQWFVRRRGFALGIGTAGFGLGGSFVLPLVAVLIEQFGWRTSYQISGVIILATFLPAAVFLIRNRPSDRGLWPDGDPAPPPDSASARSGTTATGREWTLRDLARSRQFWFLSLAGMFFFGSLSSFSLHSVPFFESEGRTATFAATLISLSALVRTPARIWAGWFLDRAPSLMPIAVGVALLHAACMALLVVSTDLPALIVFGVVWGVCGGFGPLLVSIVAARTFGPRSFATVSGAQLATETVATMTLPPLGGLLFDIQGSYDTAFVVYAVSFVFAAAAWYGFFLIPSRRSEPAPERVRA
jgi:sugar phosphate permease